MKILVLTDSLGFKIRVNPKQIAYFKDLANHSGPSKSYMVFSGHPTNDGIHVVETAKEIDALLDDL